MMTTFNELKLIDKKITQPNLPKTFEQFILEEKDLEQKDLYPDLTHGDVSIQKSYGPGSETANESRWCSHCTKNVTASSSAKYCPECANAFGTVAKADNINKQIDTNRQKTENQGGTYEYYEEEGTKADGTNYKRKGSSYTGPK